MRDVPRFDKRRTDSQLASSFVNDNANVFTHWDVAGAH
jgi:hypothetical protein